MRTHVKRVSSFLTCRMDGADEALIHTLCMPWIWCLGTHSNIVCGWETERNLRIFLFIDAYIVGSHRDWECSELKAKKKKNGMMLTGNKVAIDTKSRFHTVSLTRFPSQNLLKIQIRSIDGRIAMREFYAFMKVTLSHFTHYISRIYAHVEWIIHGYGVGNNVCDDSEPATLLLSTLIFLSRHFEFSIHDFFHIILTSI